MYRVELAQPLRQFINTSDDPERCEARGCAQPPESGSLLCKKHIESAETFFAAQLGLDPLFHMKHDVALQYGQAWTYFVGSREHGLVKIGVTTKLKSRMSSLRSSSPVPLKLFAVVFGSPSVEAALHERFDSSRRHGEWFELTDEINDCIEAIKNQEFDKYIPKGLYPETTQDRVDSLVEGIKSRDSNPTAKTRIRRSDS